jgi:Protein of unknown function (DUF1579)
MQRTLVAIAVTLTVSLPAHAAAPKADAKAADAKAVGAKAADAPPAPPPATIPAASPAPPPATPPPELAAQLKPLAGKWKCTGKVPQTAFTKAHAVTAEMTIASNLGGYFASMRYEEKKDKANKEPYAMTSIIGWDVEKKALSRIDYDNLGVISKLGAPGWSDKTLVWTGEVAIGETVGFRETLTQKGPKALTSKQEMSAADGAWVVIGELACKK